MAKEKRKKSCCIYEMLTTKRDVISMFSLLQMHLCVFSIFHRTVFLIAMVNLTSVIVYAHYDSRA